LASDQAGRKTGFFTLQGGREREREGEGEEREEGGEIRRWGNISSMKAQSRTQ
jgi:hypothetical protein